MGLFGWEGKAIMIWDSYRATLGSPWGLSELASEDQGCLPNRLQVSYGEGLRGLRDFTTALGPFRDPYGVGFSGQRSLPFRFQVPQMSLV